MRERKAIGVLLLFSAFILLTTCQLQFNKSTGNNVALRVVVPGGASGGGKSTPALGTNGKSLAGGTTLTVTISQEGTSFSTQQTVSLNGSTSIDFAFSLSSSGVYDVSAAMKDASGDTLAQNTTKLTVPSGNYPVVLTLYSSLLSNAVFSDSLYGVEPLSPTFNPTITYYTVSPLGSQPWTLTLTTVDPNATLSVTQNLIVVLPIGSAYTLTSYGTYAIVVTAADGATQTYTIYNGG